jgi:hypothetical protein
MAGNAHTEFVARGPLSALDDFPSHQTLENIARVSSTDPRWTDRFIIEMLDPSGDLLLYTGMGLYPNVNYADAFAVVGDRRLQRNVRAGRTLDDAGVDRSDLSAGPIKFVIEQPMQRWRLSAADVGQGFAFDLRFEAQTQPYEMPTMLTEREGKPLVGYSHFVQAGSYEGWLDVAGTRHVISGWIGERDRSWGYRPASARVRRGLHLWVPLHFDDLSIWFWSHEDADGRTQGTFGAVRPIGEPSRPAVPIVSLKHDLSIELVGPHRVLRAGRFVIDAADGARYEVTAEPDGPLIGLLGAGYGGPDPQGTPKGPDFIAIDSWSTADGDLLAMPHTMLKQSCRLRCGSREGRGEVELSMGEYQPLGIGPVEDRQTVV